MFKYPGAPRLCDDRDKIFYLQMHINHLEKIINTNEKKLQKYESSIKINDLFKKLIKLK